MSEKKLTNFNNPAISLQSWYVAARSGNIKPGQVKSFNLLNRRLAIYRDERGGIHALDGHCSHLGADLGLGRVIGDQVQCPFHHWRYGPDGRCCAAPGLAELPQRRVRVYPALERWGLIWLFNGPRPLFELPDAPAGEACWHLRLPPQHINCHPHLVIANGLDIRHFEALHGMEYTRPPHLTTQAPYQVTLEMEGRPHSRLFQMLSGSRRQAISASFTTIGGHLAWVAVQQPFRFYILFAGRASARGGCDTQVVFLFPAGVRLRFVQALGLMYVLLHDDHRVLNSLSFRPGFTEADLALKTFADIINAMDIW